MYDHCYRVSFDCFYVAKLLHWRSLKSVAIAGILHDFYDKPWQDDGPKKKFFEKHGFVHAKEALDNSRKYFGKYLNRKIENSILRHMFPLNKVPPRYKEGWLIVIVDKIDSMDFLLHPSLLKKCISNKTKK